MKLLLRLGVPVCLLCAASCDRSMISPAQTVGTTLAAVKARAVPDTVHVIPFYDYGKTAYNVAGPGGSGFIGDQSGLYSTTLFGGDMSCSTPYDTGSNTGCGTVYRLIPSSSTPKYKLEVLHTFTGAPADGSSSLSMLYADKNGDLYGTTFYGGAYNGGTLFKLHPNSSGYSEAIVHSFGYGQDGAYPMAGVIEVKGIFYGMTNGGGAYTNQRLCETYGGSPNGTCGTVYSVNRATGAEQVLHSFGKPGDGANPFRAELVNVNGTLYGTTYLGGALQLCGTVFSIATDGSNEHVIHSFLNNPRDGCDPLAGVINVKGTLYGTTCCGGGYYCSHCEGTLFSVDIATGQETVLHKFGNGSDGSEPDAGVTNVQGVLYGTTGVGGGTPCDSGVGCGTVFSFAPSPSNPAYKIIHRFKRPADGYGPSTPLLYTNHAFFGTTVNGGRKGHGTGVKLVQ